MTQTLTVLSRFKTSPANHPLEVLRPCQCTPSRTRMSFVAGGLSGNRHDHTTSPVELIPTSTDRKNKDPSQAWSTIHPMNLLADELLAEIFYYCIPTNRNPRLTSEAPLLLSIVCRTWRAIVLSSPQLWTRLHIRYMDDCLTCYDTPWPYIIAGIEAWLLRSGSLPLSLSISYNSVYDHYTNHLDLGHHTVRKQHPAFYRCLTMLIAQHVHRWSTLWYLGSSQLLEEILKVVIENKEHDSPGSLFPQIQNFKAICLPSWTEKDVSDPLFIPILSAPTLRKLTLQEFHGGLDNVYWGSITQLSLHGPVHRNIALTILSRCRVLEACALNIAYDDTHQIQGMLQLEQFKADEPREVTLSELTTLCIQGEWDETRSICGLLYTPILQNFLYYPRNLPSFTTLNEFNVPRPSCLPLCSFLRQCSALESLTINPTCIVGKDILAILQSCSQITRLVLDQHNRAQYPRYGYTFLGPSFKFNMYPLFQQQLVLGNAGGIEQLSEPLLPSLKSFSALGFYITDASMLEMLMDFCISRIYPYQSAWPGSTSTQAAGTTELIDDGRPPFATLERIEMRLSGVGCDISSVICLYAEAVGRRVGEDLVVDISYPSIREEGRDVVWPFVDV